MVKEYYIAGMRDSIKHTIARWIKGDIAEEECNAIIDAKLNELMTEAKTDVYNNLIEGVRKLGGMNNE